MASCSGNGSRGHHKFTLNVTETSVSTANNKSTVSWSLVLSPIQTGWNWNYSSTVPVSYKVTINGAEYTGNIMSYDGRSTVTIRSGTQDVTHNNDGTKTINFSFGVWDNISASYLPGSANGNGSLVLTKIARYLDSISISSNGSDLNSIGVKWTCSPARDSTQYSLNNGAWTNAGGTVASDNKSGTFTISGLAPNTSYSVKIRLRRTDSGLWSESNAINISTKDIGKITSAPNINFGDTARITKTNPSGKQNNVRVETLNPTTTIATRTQTSNDMTITFTDAEWDAFYKKLGNNNSITIRYVVDTVGTSAYHNYVDRTLTLKGNQKTIKNKINGSWKRGKLWIKVGGTWKRAVIWVKINGTWRRSI
jgi:hypothetical protein